MSLSNIWVKLNSENATSTTLTRCSVVAAAVFIFICSISSPSSNSSCRRVDSCWVSGLFFLFILDKLTVEARWLGSRSSTVFPVSLHVCILVPISTVRWYRYVTFCISFLIGLAFALLYLILVISRGRFMIVLRILIVVVGLRCNLVGPWQGDILESRLAIVYYWDQMLLHHTNTGTSRSVLG